MHSQLKSETLKRRKPGLELRPNHHHFISFPRRYWNSKDKGTAISDGQGWYVTESEAAKQAASKKALTP